MSRRSRNNRFKSSRVRALPTLGRSLRRIHFTVILVCLLLTGLTLGTLSLFALRNYAGENLRLTASTLSYAAQRPVVANDRQAAADLLAQLAQRRQFSQGRIITANGERLASWPPASVPVAPRSRFSRWLFPLPATASVIAGGQRVGEIWLTGEPAGIRHYLLQLVLWLGGCLLAVGALSTWLCYRMQRGIVDGLQNIASVAHDVRKRRAFYRRVPTSPVAELNELSHDFNCLLRELASWQQTMQDEHTSLSHQVEHDSLTGLPNRRAFERHLQLLIGNPLTRRQVGVLFIDGDRFKQINDQWGHAAGDQVLKITAQRLRQQLRQGDIIARLGGDEFAVLVTNVRDEAALSAVAENLVAVMAAPILLPEGVRVAQTLSIGAALSAGHPTSDALIAAADSAMYQVKNQGGDGFLLPGTMAEHATPATVPQAANGLRRQSH